MHDTKLSRRGFLRSAALLGVSATAAACAPKIVKETVVVEKQVEKVVKETIVVKEQVEKEVTKVVEKVVEKQVAAPKSSVMLRLGKSSGASRAYAPRAAKQFEEMNPNVKVIVEDVPYEDLFKKGLALGATGLLWDVFEGHNIWMPYLAWKGVTLQLDDYIATHDIKFDDFFPSVIADGRLWTEGKVMWFPTGVHPGGNAMVALNMNLLREAGVEAPCDPVTGDWTLDDWEELMRKVAKPPDTYGTEIVISHPLYTQQYSRSWGTDPAKGSPDAWLLTADGKKQQLGDEWPLVKASMEWYHKLAVDKFIPSDSQKALFPGVNLFTAGKEVTQACMVSNPENWRAAIGDKFEALYVPWPKGPSGHRGSCLSYNTMAVFTATRYPEEAFLLAAHVTGPEAALWVGTEGQGMCHARKSAWFSPVLWSRPGSGKAMEFAAKWLDSGVDPFPQPWNLRFVEWQEAWGQHTQPYRNAEEAWARMVEHTQPACQKIIDLGRA